MKVKLRSLFPKRRDKKKKKKKASSTAKGGSKLLDGVTVGVVVEPRSPTADALHGTDHYEDDDYDAAVSPVDTSIETTLDSLTDWLSDNDGSSSSSSSSDGDGDGNGNGKLRLGPERTVVFHSPQNLGVQLHRGTDGRVRVTSLTPTPTTTRSSTGTADPTLQGTIRTGDVVLEMAGTDLRQGPVDAAGWSRVVAKVKKGTSARPVTFVVAAEERRRAAAGRLSGGANSADGSKTKTRTTVPTLEIEVDPRADGAATTSMDPPRTSDTWEMEQSKAVWVEAEKRRQLEEEEARLRMLGRSGGASDDGIELVGIGDLQNMLEGAASAVADVFGSVHLVATGMQSQEPTEEKGGEPTTEEDIGRIGSNPIDLDEVPSDLSSIAANNSVDNDNGGGGGSNQGKAVDVEERRVASAKAEAARAALWKQAANKNNINSGGQTDDNDHDGDRDDGDADADADADLVRLNRINTAMFQRIDAKQRKKQQHTDMGVAREATGVSAATGLTTSGGTNASAAADMRVVREQSLTGSYTDVSENFMMESFLFLNRDDRGQDDDDDDDDDDDVDGGEEKKEEMQAAGTPMANADQNNNDVAIAAQNGDIFTEEDDYGNHYKISCGEHVVNRIDDIVCSGAVCSALPEQFLLGGDEDDDDGIEEVEEEG